MTTPSHIARLADVHTLAPGSIATVFVALRSVRHAVDRNSAGYFDLIVSDVVMPAMSGFDLAERLLARMGTVPVLFVSGYAEQALQERGLQASDVELLRKPFSPAELIERVNGLMTSAS